MTDQLEDIFAGLRAETLREVRPPGAEAARRTVRRRRTTAAVATAGAALIAMGGAAAVVRTSSHRSVPAVQRSSSPAALAEVADAKLAAHDPTIPAIDAKSPVVAGYSAHHQKFLGNLTLQVACAGTGRITLVVGGTPNRETGETAPVEQARVTATCGADPVPASVTFAYSVAIADLVFRLSDAGSAAGRAGFAYRVTSDTGTPLDPDDPANAPGRVLARPGEHVVNSGSLAWVRPTPPQFVGQPAMMSGRYRVALACAGTGVAVLQVHSESGIVAERTVTCSWPAVRVDLEAGRLDGKVTTRIGFTASGAAAAPARIAWRYIRE